MNDATFQAKLSSILTDNKFDRWVAGKRSGKLDTKRIYKIRTASTIFKKREARKGKDYSVMIVVDTSGSMSSGGGSKLDTAIQCAQKLQMHFERLKVNYKIIGFDTFIHMAKDWKDKPLPNDKFEDIFDSKYSKYITTHDFELVHETDPKFRELARDRSNFQAVDDMRGNNMDGYALNQARLDLATQKGEKIMIVLSDGQPAMDYNLERSWVFGSKNGQKDRKKYKQFSLKHEVREALKSKIVFLSVGIHDRSVEQYYPKANVMVIQDLPELYTSIVGRLTKLIRRG